MIEATLTEEGDKILSQDVAIIQRIDAAICGGMTARERAQFADLLSRCLQNALRQVK